MTWPLSSSTGWPDKAPVLFQIFATGTQYWLWMLPSVQFNVGKHSRKGILSIPLVLSHSSMDLLLQSTAAPPKLTVCRTSGLFLTFSFVKIKLNGFCTHASQLTSFRFSLDSTQQMARSEKDNLSGLEAIVTLEVLSGQCFLC